eukprot:TRINITY_DN6128_c0_g1_i3.p1 TRINITY_DN6128_c0_g1~~TRINITY_DN6128_c0_g1_i3.p1  ORF type:complete len:420 (-),score=70.67 TRINITY_DN6128_c0_g1_i3:39-1298(-)
MQPPPLDDHRTAGFSDPFAVIEAPGMKEMKTAIVKKNLNPTWNYRWVQEAESRDHFTAHVTVYDDDLIGKDYMGEVDLLLPSDLLHQESRVLQVPLKAKGKHVKDEVAGFLTFEVKIDNTIKGLVTDALAGVDLTVDPSQVEKLSINSSGSRGCQLITTITSKLAPHKWSLASVAIDSEDRIILVDNESHAVQIFDAAGNETSNFPSALRYPHLSVNASGGCIYLADSEDGTLDKFDVSGNHLGNTAQRQAFLNVIAALSNGGVATHTFEGIQILDADGKVTKAIAKAPKPGPGHLLLARAMAEDPNGRLLVAEAHNSDSMKIMVFDADYNFLFEFGKHGTGDGEFDYQRSIACDAAGRIYVLDGQLQSRVQIFSPEGKFLSSFVAGGAKDSPTAIAVSRKTGQIAILGSYLYIYSPFH